MALTGTPARKSFRFTATQAVEVQVRDFEVAGFPQVWVAATVVSVSSVADTKLHDVQVLDVTGATHVVRVGPRSGGAVRAA